MPPMIQMRAMVAFDRNGKHVQPGDLLTVYPIEAASLRYRKLADFSSGPANARSQSYGTRAMTTQTPTPPLPPPPQPAPQEPSKELEPEPEPKPAAAEPAPESGRSRRGQRGQNREMRTTEG